MHSPNKMERTERENELREYAACRYIVSTRQKAIRPRSAWIFAQDPLPYILLRVISTFDVTPHLAISFSERDMPVLFENFSPFSMPSPSSQPSDKIRHQPPAEPKSTIDTFPA